MNTNKKLHLKRYKQRDFKKKKGKLLSAIKKKEKIQ